VFVSRAIGALVRATALLLAVAMAIPEWLPVLPAVFILVALWRLEPKSDARH
jgi:hypothetical protein